MRLALHSISYAGAWGQARLPLEAILDRARALGFDGVMLAGKRPHASPLDLGPDARCRLADAIAARGLRLAALAGYTDFCAGHDRPDVPLREQDHATLRREQEAAVERWLAVQDELGVDLVVDGELYRRSMVTHFLEGWECAEVHPDPVWVLDNMYGQRPVIHGPAARPRRLLAEWYRFAAARTRRPLKATITGAYTLRDWAFDRYYPSHAAAVMALAEYVREEVLVLVEAGVKYLQIDEPAFVTRYDQPTELDVAIAAMKRVLEGVPADVLVLTHMCYGALHEVYPKMFELPATVFCLELSHASPELLRLLREQPVPKGRAIGFGVVDVMDPRVESVDEIVGRIRTALEHVPVGQLWLNPDCGLQTLAPAVATAKMRNLVEAAGRVRASLGESGTRKGAA